MANKPRWEAKYEKMLNQEPVSEKIAKLKEEIENTKRNEVGTFKTKEEYQDALREAKFKLPEQEAQLQDYENYEKNKEKIKNIYEYRKILENKLAKLPKSKKREIEDKNKELSENNTKTQEISNKVDELLAKINSGKLTSVERAATEVELQNTLQAEKLLKEKSSDLDNEIKKLNIEENSSNLDEVVAEREKYERKIAKCNLIAANLLKGKDLEDIQIKIEPSNKVFKQQKNTKEQAQEPEKQENATEKQEKAPKEGELSDPEIIDDEQENAKTNYPAKLEDFATRHPRLARIAGFFKNGFSSIKNRIARLFTRKGEAQAETENATPENTSNVEPEVENKTEQKVEEKVEEKTEQEPKLSDQEMEDVREIIKSSREAKKAETKELRENRLLSYITEYGKEDGEKAFRDSLKVELTEKQKEIKEQELKAKQKAMEARQDGATHKKDDEKGR